MSKQLYEEALADVKKLKEVAEDNAKRAILDAVTPRIRDLIENQLMGEEVPLDKDEMPVEDEDQLLVDTGMQQSLPTGEEDIPLPMISPIANVGDSENIAAAISMPDDEGKVTLDLSALQMDDANESGEKEYELNYETAQALGTLLVSKGSSVKELQNEVHKIVKTTNSLQHAHRIIKESSGYSTTIALTINKVVELSKAVSSRLKGQDRKIFESTLKKCYITLKDLMEQSKMRSRNRRLVSEADVTLKLTGLPDDVDLDDVGIDLITGDDAGEEEEDMDLGDEEESDEDLDLGGEEEETDSEEESDEDLDLGGEDEESDEDVEENQMKQYGESRRLSDNVVVEIDEGMLRREISRMKALREEDETKANSWGNGPGEVSDEFQDDDLGDPFVDVDLTTESDDQQDEADEKQDESNEMDELDESNEMEEQEHQDEADEMEEKAQAQQESRIRRAIVRERQIQLEAKKKAQSAKKQGQKAQQEAQQKAKQKKQKEAQQKQKTAKQMKEAYEFYARRYNTSVLRENKLKGMLVEARSRNAALVNESAKRSAEETSNLRNKLAETNLFNAKLLFTNKLLQNEALTKRQKAQIIERLDEARSEREVKLVYESVVKTLQNPARQISESAAPRVLGSASRATRPAATLNESFEVDRWARLAGIK